MPSSDNAVYMWRNSTIIFSTNFTNAKQTALLSFSCTGDDGWVCRPHSQSRCSTGLVVLVVGTSRCSAVIEPVKATSVPGEVRGSFARKWDGIHTRDNDYPCKTINHPLIILFLHAQFPVPTNNYGEDDSWRSRCWLAGWINERAGSIPHVVKRKSSHG